MEYWETLKTITAEYLRAHPDHIFVFGDNTIRKGKGGAATLRDEPNTWGFITKKLPNNHDDSFYRPADYQKVFHEERQKLIDEIVNHPERTYLISKLGAGLANRYRIWEEVIRPGLVVLGYFKNVVFLFKDEEATQ